MSGEAAQNMGRLIDYAELMINGQWDECVQQIQQTGHPVEDAAMLSMLVGFMLQNSAVRQGFPIEEIIRSFRLEAMEQFGEPPGAGS